MNNTVNFITQEKVLIPIIIIVVTFVINIIITKMVSRLFGGKDNYRAKKNITIAHIVNRVITIFIYLIAVIMILSRFGIDTSGILTSLGVAGVVIGLALQETFQDILAGINIIVSNYYVVGDIIKVNDFTGTVTELSLRNTKVKAVSGEVYVFPNHTVNGVINYSQARAGVRLSIQVSYDNDPAKVETVLKSIVANYAKKEELSKESKYLGIDKLDSSSINYGILIYSKPQDRWATEREVLRTIVDEFNKNGIKIPYNQIEVHNGKNI